MSAVILIPQNPASVPLKNNNNSTISQNREVNIAGNNNTVNNYNTNSHSVFICNSRPNAKRAISSIMGKKVGNCENYINANTTYDMEERNSDNYNENFFKANNASYDNINTDLLLTNLVKRFKITSDTSCNSTSSSSSSFTQSPSLITQILPTPKVSPIQIISKTNLRTEPNDYKKESMTSLTNQEYKNTPEDRDIKDRDTESTFDHFRNERGIVGNQNIISPNFKDNSKKRKFFSDHCDTTSSLEKFEINCLKISDEFPNTSSRLIMSLLESLDNNYDSTRRILNRINALKHLENMKNHDVADTVPESEINGSSCPDSHNLLNSYIQNKLDDLIIDKSYDLVDNLDCSLSTSRLHQYASLFLSEFSREISSLFSACDVMSSEDLNDVENLNKQLLQLKKEKQIFLKVIKFQHDKIDTMQKKIESQEKEIDCNKEKLELLEEQNKKLNQIFVSYVYKNSCTDVEPYTNSIVPKRFPPDIC